MYSSKPPFVSILFLLKSHRIVKLQCITSNDIEAGGSYSSTFVNTDASLTSHVTTPVLQVIIHPLPSIQKYLSPSFSLNRNAIQNTLKNRFIHHNYIPYLAHIIDLTTTKVNYPWQSTFIYEFYLMWIIISLNWINNHFQDIPKLSRLGIRIWSIPNCLGTVKTSTFLVNCRLDGFQV